MQSRLVVFLAGTVFGVLCTVAILGLTVIGVTSEPDATDANLPSVPGDRPASRTATPGASDAAAAAATPTTLDGAVEDRPPADRHGAANPPDARRRAAPAERIPIPVSDAHRSFLGGEDGSGRTTLHGRLEREPEDAAWSYFMEQSLGQFIGQHENAALFSVFNIECRTTMCEIQVVGYDDSTSPDWSRILYDLERQPWYDFGQVGTSGADYEGQLALVTHLQRRETAPDNR